MYSGHGSAAVVSGMSTQWPLLHAVRAGRVVLHVWLHLFLPLSPCQRMRMHRDGCCDSHRHIAGPCSTGGPLVSLSGTQSVARKRGVGAPWCGDIAGMPLS